MIILNEENTLAISVIVPLYNAERYIDECLRSILNQTFQNFEVIVVDDGSTDDSVNKVKNLMPEFNGRLKLIERDKNSGGPAIPRNIGLGFARGKYVCFIDNDDLFTENALNDFYTIAESTQADVVHAESFLSPKNNEEHIDENTEFNIDSAQSNDFVDSPILENLNMPERLSAFHLKRYWFVWNKLIRRDFLIKNQIYFPDIVASDDLVFSFYCTCLAKRYVRIPNICNIYRRRDGSLSHESLTVEDYMHKWVTVLIKIIKYMSEFMNQQEFFIINPGFKYIALEIAMKDIFFFIGRVYKKFKPQFVAEFLEREFLNCQGDNVTLMTYFFSASNVFRMQMDNLNQTIIEKNKQILELENKLKRLKKRK